MVRFDRRMVAAAVVAGGMAVASAAPAFAEGPPTTFTPGAPNCHGQFIASSNNNGIPQLGISHLSIGQASQLFGVPVQQIQGIVDAECSV